MGVRGQQKEVRPGRLGGKLGDHPAGFLLLSPDHRLGIVPGHASAVAGFGQQPDRLCAGRFPQPRPAGGVDELQLQGADPPDGKGILPFLLLRIQNPVNLLLRLLPHKAEQRFKRTIDVIDRPDQAEAAFEAVRRIGEGELARPPGFPEGSV